MILFNRLLLLLLYLFLVGCATNTPEKLGLSDLEWESYSPGKQKDLLANYERMMKEREGKVIEQEDDRVKNGPFLEVIIYGGKIMFPPSFVNWQSYQPIHFDIFRDECRDILVKQSADSELKTELGVCFKDNILYLDSSRTDPSKKEGTVTIYYSPLWLSGFYYKDINSSGYVKLSNVTVAVKQKEMVPEPPKVGTPNN